MSEDVEKLVERLERYADIASDECRSIDEDIMREAAAALTRMEAERDALTDAGRAAHDTIGALRAQVAALTAALGEARKALRAAGDFIEDEADNRSAAGSSMSDYEREPRELLERIDSALSAIPEGGEGKRSSSTGLPAHVADATATDAQSPAGMRHPSQMPAELRREVDEAMRGTYLGSLTEADEDWFFDMDGKP